MITELPKEELLVIEFYNILIPPIFAGYIILFAALLNFKTEEPVETEKFLMLVQRLAETCHNMGVIQSPTFCSIYYMRQAFAFLLEKGVVVEKPTLLTDKMRKCYVVNNRPALKLIVQNCRAWFLWDENYNIVKRVFEDKYLKTLMDEVGPVEEAPEPVIQTDNEPQPAPLPRQRL